MKPVNRVAVIVFQSFGFIVLMRTQTLECTTEVWPTNRLIEELILTEHRRGCKILRSNMLYRVN